MPQNPQNTISQNEVKHFNQYISARTEALVWLQIATDTGKKLKFETAVNEIYQHLLDFITIDVLMIE